MCGICGAMAFPGGASVRPNVIARMRDTMTHRGPDDAGVYVDPTCAIGMGHRRLAIVDLSSAGHGPMANEDESIWIAYNGEVYNHAEHRSPLERLGHRYRSATDTETLLHLYEEHGVAMLERLRGMFAFSLWDGNKQQLMLARDRVGIKPLYYAVFGNTLIWGSEIKALLAHPAAAAELDEDALAQYLTFAAVPPPATLFAGIKKLAAGHVLIAEPGGKLEVRRWWSPAGHALPEALQGADEASVGKYLLELLDSAVIEQTMADVPHGLLLSGGLDSSLILALLSRHMDQPVKTFSVGFEGHAHFDERPHAKRVADRFGADHHELVLQPQQVAGMIPELVHAQDEPLSDWVCLPLRLLAGLVRESGVIVAQVGEGSDELFAGYPRYRRYAAVQRTLYEPFLRLPRSVRRAVGRVASAMLAGSPRLREPRDLFRRAARGEPLFVSGAVANWDSEKASLLTRGAIDRLGLNMSSAAIAARHLAEFAEIAPTGDYAAAMAYQDLMIRLPELLLMRVDKMTMLSSIEARVPFLDHRLVEIAMALPQALKLKHGRTKHILKLAAAPLVGATTAERPKKGFDVPLSAWLREEPLGSWAQHTVMDSGLMQRDIFDRAHLGRMIRDHREGRADHAFRIWNVLNACAWYDHWIDQKR